MVLGSGIRDLGSGKNQFWIPDPGVKRHRIPDLELRHWDLGSRMGKKFWILIWDPDPGRTTLIIFLRA